MTWKSELMKSHGNQERRMKPYRVIQEHGWSFVVGDPPPESSGPYRYEHEAQDYADELNAAAGRPVGQPEPPEYCKARNLRPFHAGDCMAPECSCQPH
jgi:hypothetical protein